jgi:hypothetical protein
MEQIGEFAPDNLLAGDFPRVTDWLEIPSGILKRGSVLEEDGTLMETGGDPHCVLCVDVDATAGAVTAPVYLSGGFARRYLILADGEEISDADKKAMRKAPNLYVIDTIPA